MIAFSIGGNDFYFGDIVQSCVEDFLAPAWWGARCSKSSENLARVAPAAQASVRSKITAAIGRVEHAMDADAYSKSDFSIVVQNYPSPLPPVNEMRYGQFGYTRLTTGGCGLYNVDIAWADQVLLPAINRTVSDAVNDAHEPNVELMNISRAFVGQRLCEKGVGLLEDERIKSWRDSGAADKTEWILQIRASKALGISFAGFELQESLHPDYWGQLALRNCLRQAYGDGHPHGGSCVHLQKGLDAGGEPNMVLK